MQRIAIVMLYDAQGRLDLASRRFLEGLRPHVGLLVAVSNGALDEAARAALAAPPAAAAPPSDAAAPEPAAAIGLPLADVVLERENEGFDVEAYRHGLRWLDEHRAGDPRIAGADELLLANYTCFGPIGPDGFGGAFARAAALEADLWGMTEHAAIPDPYRHRGTLAAHLQSHWLVARRSLLERPEWREYWASMPPIRAYDDSIRHHEARATAWFRARGFRVAALYPSPVRPGEAQPAANPAMERPAELLEAGCPLLKRRVAWMDPIELDHRGVDAARAIELALVGGFPAEAILDAAREASPRAVVANLGLAAPALPEPARPGPAVGSGEPDVDLAECPAAAASLADLLDAAGGARRGEPLLAAARPEELGRARRELGRGWLGPALLARSLGAAPWRPALALLAPDDLGADARGDAERLRSLAARAAAALGLEGLRLDDAEPVRVGGGPAAVAPELARALAEPLRAAGGAAAFRRALGLEREELDDALGVILPALAVRRGEAVVEVATAGAWARRASRARVREAALRASLPAGVREPFRAAAARAAGELHPRRIAEVALRRAPGPARAARGAVSAAVERLAELGRRARERRAASAAAPRE